MAVRGCYAWDEAEQQDGASVQPARETDSLVALPFGVGTPLPSGVAERSRRSALQRLPWRRPGGDPLEPVDAPQVLRRIHDEFGEVHV